MANNVAFSSLDFNAVKDNLKKHLKSQNRFRDYDFEGSNMAVLLDVLAYNTYLNNHYNNMAISEMFLDTASLENSVASHAKELGYTPRSRTSARAVVTVTLSVTGTKPPFVNIPAKTKFTARCANRTFTFTNQKTQTVFPSNGVYTLAGVELHEGEWKTELIEVKEGMTEFTISDKNADISSIEVQVRENNTTTSPKEEYLFKSSIFGVFKNDEVFYLQPALDGKYSVLFGSDKFGKQPKVGAVIEISYRTSNGDAANGIEVFTPASTISSYNATTKTTSKSSGGAEKESLESIKFHAPKSVQIQDRAITESDFGILLKNNFPEIESVSVFGGEEADPPQYGRVIVAVDIKNITGVTLAAKERYRRYLKERTALAIEPVVISPDFMYVDIVSTITYNTSTTTKSPADIRSSVKAAIDKFNLANLNNFAKNLRYSKFVEAIDDADNNIVGNNTKIRPFMEIVPRPGILEAATLHFRNKLHRPVDLTNKTDLTKYVPAIKSSSFNYGTNNVLAYIQDDGKGNLHIIQDTKNGFVYLEKNIGTVNYNNGKVVIKKLTVSAVVGGTVKVFAEMRSNDIIGPKERMLSIRPKDVRIKIRAQTDDE